MRVSDVAKRVTAPVPTLLVALGLAACGDHSVLPPNADIGPAPQIVKPVTSAIPHVNIAPAIGWPRRRRLPRSPTGRSWDRW